MLWVTNRSCGFKVHWALIEFQIQTEELQQ